MKNVRMCTLHRSCTNDLIVQQLCISTHASVLKHAHLPGSKQLWGHTTQTASWPMLHGQPWVGNTVRAWAATAAKQYRASEWLL